MTVAKKKACPNLKKKTQQTDKYNVGMNFYINFKQSLYSKSGQSVISFKVQQRNFVMELNKYSLLATYLIQNNIWKK